MSRPIVVNLFGAPGTTKSTTAASVFSRLKMLGINCEYVQECAKDMVWEGNSVALSNQVYVFANQYHKMFTCGKHVDVIITDSPLAMSPLYNCDPDIDAAFRCLVLDIYGKYDNLNYMMHRVKPYSTVGRIHSEAESAELDKKLRILLGELNVTYTELPGDEHAADTIVSDVVSRLESRKTT